jgi:hypothetical protein
MKTHDLWHEAAWKAHCRVFAQHIHDGTPPPFRSIEAFTLEYNRRVQAVLERHLAAGLTIFEACRTRWTATADAALSFIPACRNPQHIAEHLTNRALGFGWSLQLVK